MSGSNAAGRSVTIGFDSAWADTARSPGAICALAWADARDAGFLDPRTVSFAEALSFIEEARQQASHCLVAIDQPTVVPNGTGSRPVDRVAASVISYAGGGVQPANRGKRVFADRAPIWRFLDALGAQQDPDGAKQADHGLFLIEVFPALALTGWHARCAERLGAPKYNPANRRKFRMEDWAKVTRVVADTARDLGVPALAAWSDGMATMTAPRKSDQDRLDAAICALIGLAWRRGPSDACLRLGDVGTGYMVTPVSAVTRARLIKAAEARQVPFESPAMGGLAPARRNDLGPAQP